MAKIYLIYGLCFQGYGVVLVNTDEAGTLIVTNFRLIFLVSIELNIFCMLIFFFLDMTILLAYVHCIPNLSSGTCPSLYYGVPHKKHGRMMKVPKA